MAGVQTLHQLQFFRYHQVRLLLESLLWCLVQKFQSNKQTSPNYKIRSKRGNITKSINWINIATKMTNILNKYRLLFKFMKHLRLKYKMGLKCYIWEIQALSMYNFSCILTIAIKKSVMKKYARMCQKTIQTLNKGNGLIKKISVSYYSWSRRFLKIFGLEILI